MRYLAVFLAALVVLPSMPAVHAAPRTAPPFELELFGGKTFRLVEARGSAVVLLFWAPW